VVYIRYNPSAKRYVVHEITMWGSYDPAEGFLHAYRSGDEIKLVGQDGANIIRVQRLTWQSATKSWHIESRMVDAGKEGELFIDLKATATK